jgi:GAG-pre-integrase domain
MCGVTFVIQISIRIVDLCPSLIFLTDGINVPIEGNGTMEFTAVNSSNRERLTIMVKNVAYVPKFTVNLISVAKLTMEHELEVIFSHNMCALVKDGKRFELAAIENSLYVHNPEAHESHAARVSPCIHHWHRVLAHRNVRYLKRVASAMGIKYRKCDCSDTCESCIQGKLPANPYPKESEKPSEPLDIVVTDICGPFRVESIGKSKYFMTMIDLATGYTEVETLRERSQCKAIIMNYVM